MKSKNKILVIWSNYYTDLAQQQLDSCLELLNKSEYEYTLEVVDAGTYEIPAVIRHYQQTNPYAGYITLGLLLKGSTDHYEFIWEHIKECFIKFALDGVLIGNTYRPYLNKKLHRLHLTLRKSFAQHLH